MSYYKSIKLHEINNETSTYESLKILQYYMKSLKKHVFYIPCTIGMYDTYTIIDITNKYNTSNNFISISSKNIIIQTDNTLYKTFKLMSIKYLRGYKIPTYFGIPDSNIHCILHKCIIILTSYIKFKKFKEYFVKKVNEDNHLQFTNDPIFIDELFSNIKHPFIKNLRQEYRRGDINHLYNNERLDDFNNIKYKNIILLNPSSIDPEISSTLRQFNLLEDYTNYINSELNNVGNEIECDICGRISTGIAWNDDYLKKLCYTCIYATAIGMVGKSSFENAIENK